MMKHVIVLFWALCLGQVVGYIGGALNHGTYNFLQTAIVSLITALVVIAIGETCGPSKKKTEQNA